VQVENQKSEKNKINLASGAISDIPNFDFVDMDNAKINYLGNWIWRAVDCLVGTKDFNSSGRWISNRLKISVEEAVDAMDGLQAMGVIYMGPGGRFRRANNVNEFTEKEFGRNQLIMDHLMVSAQINSKFSRFKDKPIEDASFTNFVITSTRKRYLARMKEIHAIFREWSEEHNESEIEEVYGLTFSCINMAPRSSEKDDER